LKAQFLLRTGGVVFIAQRERFKRFGLRSMKSLTI
jgi:hypothetical protein